MTTDPPPSLSSSGQREAFLRDLVSALRDVGVEKIDANAAAAPGAKTRLLLADQHRSRSSTSSTFSSSPSLTLARAVHARLQFDYPALDSSAVDALSKAVGGGSKFDLLLPYAGRPSCTKAA